MKSASGFRRFRQRAFAIILLTAVSLLISAPTAAKAKAKDKWMTWDMVYLQIYDWWGKTSSEEITVEKIEPILLSDNERAFLAGTWFFSRGRNFIAGAVLVRPALQEVRDVSEYCRPDFKVRDLDRDGVSEIITETLGSGGGTTSGTKRILQFDGWNPVILHEADFEDHSGVGSMCEGCEDKSVEWQFLELPGRTNVLEIIHFSSGPADSRTLITLYALQDKKFTPFNGAVMKWDESAGAKPESGAKAVETADRLSRNFMEHRGLSQFFDKVAPVYRESVHKPPLPYELRELSKKADKAAKDKSYNLSAAIAMYTEALDRACWWPGGYFKRALLHAELGHFGSALQDLDRYLMLEPASADAGIAREKIQAWKETLLKQNFEEMAVIPGGEFMMGSPSCTDGQRHSSKTKLPCDNELPQHRVSIKRFEMGKYDVTHDQWNACVADGGCKAYRGDGKRPVDSVS